MCCFEDEIRPYIDRTIQRFTNGGSVAFSGGPADMQTLSLTSEHRGPRCSLGTLVASTEASIAFLEFVIRVESKCEQHQKLTNDSQQGAGEWQEEVDGLLHRRVMLLRVAECCAVLLGRYAVDVDMRDSCAELVHRLKNLLQIEGAVASNLRAKQRRIHISQTISFMRGAMRVIFETL